MTFWNKPKSVSWILWTETYINHKWHLRIRIRWKSIHTMWKMKRQAKKFVKENPYAAGELTNAYYCLAVYGVNLQEIRKHEIQLIKKILLSPDIRAGLYYTNESIVTIGNALKEIVTGES